MKRNRCPECHGILPAPKTCANPRCAKVFYRTEKGRISASYCSARCGTAHRVRRWRERRASGIRYAA